MKKSSKLTLLFLAMLLVLSCMAGCSESPDPEGSQISNFEMPADLESFINDELLMVESLSDTLTGEWGDGHAELIALGLDGSAAMATDEYAALKAILDEQRETLDAYYVYAMIPTSDEDKPEYCITVDGSVEPDIYGTNYGWEIQFDEAWAGEPAAARSAWDDDVPCWSVFAPVYTTDGQIACIIGIDYPCELVEQYPEWNRDRQGWNRLEE